MPQIAASAPTKKRRWWIIIAGSAAVAAVGIIPGLGLPGMLMILLGDSILSFTLGFAGYQSITRIPGDGLWQLSLLATLTVFPLGIALSLADTTLFAGRSALVRWIGAGSLFVAWSLIAAGVLQAWIA